MAVQQQLYRRATLEAEAPADLALIRALIAERSGIALDPPEFGDFTLTLKRVQLLDWGSVPIVELAYLPPAGAPVSYCLMPTPAADIDPVDERIEGINLVHWRRAGMAYAVLGDHAHGYLRRLAGATPALRARPAGA